MHILNQMPVMEMGPPIITILFGGLFAIISILVFLEKDRDIKHTLKFGIIIVFVLLLTLIADSKISVKESGRYQYEVYIDDKYTAAELLREFKVLEQRGTLYLIEDREDIK